MRSAHSYPPAEPHTIMPSPVRGRTEPAARRGFMRSIMRPRDVDDSDIDNIDEGIVIFNNQDRKVSQEEQDAEDEKARKRAMRDLINSWQERLQLISVITTFFATTEAAMLVNTKPLSMKEFDDNILKVSNAGFLGSLILHVYASVLSFLGAFFLISYKLREAAREEMIIEGIPVASPLEASVSKDVERDAADLGAEQTASRINGRRLVGPPLVFSANPHIEPVGPLTSHASSHRILSRIHAVCVFLTAAGFVLAIVGIVSYAWAAQPRAVGIFTSVCLGGALLAMLVLAV